MEKLLAFLILILLSLALKTSSKLEHEGFNLSKTIPTLQGTQIQALDSISVGRKYKDISIESKKAKGKGTYGGANIAHRPRQQNSRSTASLSVIPSILSTITMLCVSYTFILEFLSQVSS